MSRVLIVEDDPDLREVYTAALEDEGFDVEVAAEGMAALAKLEAELPCALLLDLRMPGMNGWQLAERIRESDRLSQIPIVVVAAHYLLADEARRIGAAAWLQKPVSLPTLIGAVEDACRTGGNGHAASRR